MSSVAEIRHHIKVVQDTSKITKAMYLISSAKMKKALRMNDQNLIYFRRVRSDIRFILDNTPVIDNPYFRPHGTRAAFLVIAGDKGLCGGYNSEVLKAALKVIEGESHKSVTVFTIGYTARDFFIQKGMHPDAHYTHIIQDPSLENARMVTQEMCTRFREKELDEVYVIYTRQQKMGVQHPNVIRLLPVLKEDFAEVETLHAPTGDLNFHPSASQVLDELIPHYLVGLVYSTLVQAYASEHYARMTAMDAATRNADEMLARLKLQMNHARQAMITQEITEIISGNPDQGEDS